MFIQDSSTMEDYIREIKHAFMTYRNGVIADTLRKAGMPYSLIFGLQLPQLSSIARSVPHSVELADRLWADKNVRESRLLACWIYPTDSLPMGKAIELASETITREETDILCFRLLRNLPYAAELLTHLSGYPAEALARNLQ